MARLKIHRMHLDGPAEAESFMLREGVDPEGDDMTEWLDNEKNFDVDDEELDVEAGDNEDEDSDLDENEDEGDS